MRTGIVSITALGMLALQASAGDLPSYPASQAPNSGWMPYNAYPNFGPQQPCYGNACSAHPPKRNANYCDDNGGREGQYRLERFKEWLCYRPTEPCEFWLRKTMYVPPNYTWFPPICHAGGCCGTVCGCVRQRGFGKDHSSCGPTCGNATGPMSGGYPVVSAPPIVPGTVGNPASASARPVNHPATVAYTKPAAVAKPATVFVPAAQPMGQAAPVGPAMNFAPTWSTQQSSPQQVTPAAATSSSSSAYPPPPTTYYIPPRN